MKNGFVPTRMLFVVLNPGPTAAAVFDMRENQPEAEKIWTGGKRPAWIRSASRNMKTVLLDAPLPTFADASENPGAARRKMERMGLDESSEYGRVGNCTVAIRKDGIKQAFSLAEDEGLVADFATSFATVELAAFTSEEDEKVSARVSFYEKTAFLTSKTGTGLSSRRFAFPGGMDELSASLRAFDPAHVKVIGCGENVTNSTEQTLQDRQTTDTGKAYESVMTRATILLKNGNLALFSIPGQRTSNIATRWLPPLATAFAILCVGTAFPLWNAYVGAAENNRLLAVLENQDREIRARSVENKSILKNIEDLSHRRNARISELTSAGHIVETVLTVQDALKTTRHVNIAKFGTDNEGETLSISGTVSRGTEGELERFVSNLTKSGYRLAAKTSLENEDGKTRFDMELEARK